MGGAAGGFGGQLAITGASTIADAAIRSAIEGSSFGDNIVAAIPDVIAQRLSSLVIDTVATNGSTGYVDEVISTGTRRKFDLSAPTTVSARVSLRNPTETSTASSIILTM